MGRLSNLRVNLENSHLKYRPGEIVNGTVDFELKSELKIYSIRARFNGSTTVHW